MAQVREAGLILSEPSSPRQGEGNLNILQQLSQRLQNLEKSTFKKMERLSTHNLEQLEICVSECRAAISGMCAGVKAIEMPEAPLQAYRKQLVLFQNAIL